MLKSIEVFNMVMTTEQVQQIFPFLIAGCMFLLLILFWLKNFIFCWLKVRASGGSKILVRIRNDLHNYYRVGSLDGVFLYFNARKRPDLKNPRKQLPICPQGSDKPMLKECLYRDWGVNVVDVDDIKECFLKYKNGSYESLATGNAEAYDLAIQKAQMQPPKGMTGLVDPKTAQIITFIGLGIILLAVVYEISITKNILTGLIQTYNNTETIKGMLSTLLTPKV
jgi:hypothetical protein